MQETCARAFRRIERLEELDNPRTWLLCILRRLYIDGTRRYERRHVRSTDDAGLAEFADGGAGPAESAETAAIRGRIDAGLQRLSSEQRSLLLLHDVEGYSIAELQQIMELKSGTIKSKLHRARVRLGRYLESAGCLDGVAGTRRTER